MQAVSIDPPTSPGVRAAKLMKTKTEGKSTIGSANGIADMTIGKGLQDIRFWMLVLVLLITNCKKWAVII